MGILYYAILESIGVLVTVSIHACNLHGVLPGPSQSKPHGAKKERTAFGWICRVLGFGFAQHLGVASLVVKLFSQFSL